MTAALRRLFEPVKQMAFNREGNSAPEEQTTPKQQAVELVRKIVQESSIDRKNRQVGGGKTIEQWWQFGARRWMGDHHDFEPREGLLQFTLPRDEVSIVNNVADQTARPIRPQFSPVEQDDNPTYFVSTRAARVLLEGREAGDPVIESVTQGMSGGQIGGTEEITAQQAQNLRKLAKTNIDPSDGTEIPSILDHRAIVKINDAFRATIAQRVFGIKWKQAHGDEVAQENELYSNIFGHSILWGEMNEEDWTFDLENPHVKEVLLDPTKTVIWRSKYAVITERMGLEEAKMEFPAFAERLVEAKALGRIGDSTEWELGSQTSRTDFQTDQILIRIAWIRDQPFPMSPQEAVQEGIIGPDADGAPIYIDTGDPADPDDDAWPIRKGIRQIKVLDTLGEVLMDEECPYTDFPLGLNRNLPIPYSPYGKGESQRLESITDALNEVGAIILNHLLYWKYPQEYWPASLLQQLEESGVEPHGHPGLQVRVNDADWIEWFRTGRLQGFLVTPPPIPAHVIQVWADFRSEHELLSGHTGVRQGVPPSADISGKAIQELATQAGGVVAYKARFTELAVSQVAKVLTDALIEYMPAQEWRRYATDLTPEAFDVVWRGMADLKYDILVELGSARGNEQAVEERRAAEDLERGAIGMRTYRLKRSLDPDAQDREVQEERQQLAQVQGAEQGPQTTQ